MSWAEKLEVVAGMLGGRVKRLGCILQAARGPLSIQEGQWFREDNYRVERSWIVQSLGLGSQSGHKGLKDAGGSEDRKKGRSSEIQPSHVSSTRRSLLLGREREEKRFPSLTSLFYQETQQKEQTFKEQSGSSKFHACDSALITRDKYWHVHLGSEETKAQRD